MCVMCVRGIERDVRYVCALCEKGMKSRVVAPDGSLGIVTDEEEESIESDDIM